MGTALHIALCGGLAVELEGERIEARLAGRQGREVFAYLALNRPRQVSRDEVAAMLWPEQAPRAPEAALNTILARLRRVLGQSALGGRGQLTLELAPGSWVDVESAEQAAGRAEALLSQHDPRGARTLATDALGLLAAPLLPEVTHTWVAQWRSDVDDLCTRLRVVGVRAGLTLGGADLEDAERSAQRLIEREPFRESGYAMLMEVQTARGDVAQALMVYERLRRLLRDELGVPPSPQLAALHQSLLDEQPVARSPAPSADTTPSVTPVPLPGPLARGADAPMVGRHDERQRLLAPWSQASAQRPSLVLIAGEPGIGKSTLVASFAREIHARPAIVLYGQAEEDPIVPYVAVVEALRHYLVHTPQLAGDAQMAMHLAELRWLIPELTGPPAQPPPSSGDLRVDRLRLYRAAAAVIAHAASRHEVLLVLEDLQWADRDTLLVARQLLRETTDHPVRAVFTYREGEVDAEHALSRTLADLRRDVAVTPIRLSGLDHAQIGEMLRGRRRDDDRGDEAPPELVRRLHEHTSGNPFFIQEVVRSLDELGTGIDDPEAAGSVLLLPDGVQAVIQERLHRLAPPTREALAAAAVLGDTFSLDMLEAVLGDEWRASAIDTAVRAGLLLEHERSGGRYRFCHALAREAIYRSTGAGQRAELHLTAARALEQRRGRFAVEAAEIAYHLAASNRSETTMEAIGYLREAAQRALAGHAYDGAGKHLQFAIELIERDRPQDSATRCELLLELGQASWQAADPGARAVYLQALAVAQGLGRPERLAEAALGLGGRFYAPVAPDIPYIQLLEQTLESLADEDGPLRTRMLGRLAEHLMLADPARAQVLSEAALRAARGLDDPPLLAATLLSRHASLLAVEHLEQRRRLAEEQVELARACGERELEALGIHWLLYDHLESGDAVAAGRTLPRLSELSEGLRQPLYLHSALVWRRILDQLAGRFDRAEQLSHEALNLSQEAQGHAAKIHFVSQRMSVVRDTGGAERLLETSRKWPSEGSMLWLSARWLLELECGELVDDPERDAAVRDIAALPRDVFWLPIMAWLAEVIAIAGEAGQAAALYELLLPWADRWIQLAFNGTFGSVRRPLGLLAARMGRPDDAGDLLAQAVDRHASAAAPALEARARYDYGRAITEGRATGSPAQGEAMLQRAREQARECGATRLVATITRAVRDATVGSQR